MTCSRPSYIFTLAGKVNTYHNHQGNAGYYAYGYPYHGYGYAHHYGQDRTERDRVFSASRLQNDTNLNGTISLRETCLIPDQDEKGLNHTLAIVLALDISARDIFPGMDPSFINFLFNGLIDTNLNYGSKFSEICTGTIEDISSWFRPSGNGYANVNASTSSTR